ncbi:methyltransferase [Vibrio sp. S4M6]|uniref:methyltransferase n=1 Tax=Vibrio sinus TaxID=2946865 RepID=UPI00202A5913|nr:methyltransferase [Vibrio sinus]MCL9781625.1 methyltransferase [Vibrio sinus]
MSSEINSIYETSECKIEHTGSLPKVGFQNISIPGLTQDITLTSTSSVITQDYYTDHFLENIDILSDSLSKNKSLKSVELGSGRGLLSLAIKLKFPSIDITLIDKNKSAIELSRNNLNINGIKKFNVDFSCFTSSKYRDKSFDLLLSTLPTLPFNLENVDRKNTLCLDGGSDGLRNLRNLGHNFLSYCKNTGKMFFMANDLIDIKKLIHEFDQMGIESNIISKRKKYLSETIYTKSLVDNGTICHNRLQGNPESYYFHTLLIQSEKKFTS